VRVVQVPAAIPAGIQSLLTKRPLQWFLEQRPSATKDYRAALNNARNDGLDNELVVTLFGALAGAYGWIFDRDNRRTLDYGAADFGVRWRVTHDGRETPSVPEYRRRRTEATAAMGRAMMSAFLLAYSQRIGETPFARQHWHPLVPFLQHVLAITSTTQADFNRAVTGRIVRKMQDLRKAHRGSLPLTLAERHFTTAHQLLRYDRGGSKE